MDETDKPREHVLIVDDDLDTRRVLEKSLSRLGYDVSSASNGAEGLAMALEAKPHVVLSDLRMPEMDGHTLLRRLAAYHLDTAVVVMSGQGAIRDVIDVLRAGAVDFLAKPWTANELVTAMTRAVEMHDLRKRARGSEAPLETAAVPVPATKTAIMDPALAQVIADVSRGEAALPPFPAVLSELRAALSKPETTMREIGALVEHDSRLTLQILQAANSPMYTRGARIDDVQTAVTRLGLRHVQSVVQTVFFSGSHVAHDKGSLVLQRRIWRYSIARAVAMRGLADLVSAITDVQSETAYLAGLLADVGATFILWALGERSLSVDSASSLAWLRDYHQDIGAQIVALWKLDELTAVIAQTHHATAPPTSHAAYWRLAILGSAMADELTGVSDMTATQPKSQELIDRCGAELRIGTSAIRKLYVSVRREFEGIMESLK